MTFSPPRRRRSDGGSVVGGVNGDGGNGGKQCSRPRRIYIDMGVNWCNTLQLFRDLPEAWLPQGLGTHHSLAQGPAPPWCWLRPTLRFVASPGGATCHWLGHPDSEI